MGQFVGAWPPNLGKFAFPVFFFKFKTGNIEFVNGILQTQAKQIYQINSHRNMPVGMLPRHKNVGQVVLSPVGVDKHPCNGKVSRLVCDVIFGGKGGFVFLFLFGHLNKLINSPKFGQRKIPTQKSLFTNAQKLGIGVNKSPPKQEFAEKERSQGGMD
ncbi:MAG: hypothetical protein H6581_27955 [Bacteroidia bacterium]|nr:hypothetical protein [Bacteroidia bacterium]